LLGKRLPVRRKIRRGIVTKIFWENKTIDIRGVSSFLKGLKRLGLFCSNKCPGEIILKCQDWANGLSPSDAVVIGGFHTPIEKDVLRILLRSKHPVVICPARSLTKMRLSASWKEALEAGNLCLASDFPKSITRATKETAEQRNHFVASLSNSVFIPYAAPGSKTEALAEALLKKKLFVYTFNSPYNKNLLGYGSKPIQ
jgi:predicted Rossmann fold nucleotide-binding protein DprA/Smf involved in DNA uptake